MQVGTIKMAGRSVPTYLSGTELWVLCDGALLLVALYPALFAVIGYSYGGVGPNFAVPNYGFDAITPVMGRMPVGVDGAGYALGNQAGTDGHDHLMPMLSVLVHTGVLTTTLSTPTILVEFGGADGMEFVHWHHLNPLFDHDISGQPIGYIGHNSPYLAVGFYIRAR